MENFSHPLEKYTSRKHQGNNVNVLDLDITRNFIYKSITIENGIFD